MIMQTIQQLFDYARLADASYIDLLNVAWQNAPRPVADEAIRSSRLPEQLAKDTFNTAPGGRQVVGYDDSQNATTGFSATLFKNTEGKCVLAIRGTDSEERKTDVALRTVRRGGAA